MELFAEKNQCCGCMACADACPKGAISARADREGFWYPEIRQELCVDCGQCAAVCPLSGGKSEKRSRRYFAAQAKDPALRGVSTSGAMFPILAEQVLEGGGAVYGAAFDGAMRVAHRRAAGREELEPLLQTKYVQSSTAGIFRRVRQDLAEGRQVLFVGTPCQTEALRRFCPEKAPGLVLADLICYGVPSPGVWERYVSHLEKKHCGRLTAFHFRDKRKGNDGHTVSYTAGGQEYVKDYLADLFSAMYFSNLMHRPSCHSCPFTTVERNSDLTIGDFWGVEKVFPEWNDGMGTSLVIVHSERGQALWDRVCGRLRWGECQKEDVLQPRLLSPTQPASKRGRFFALYRALPFGLFLKLFQHHKVRRFLYAE